VSEIKNFIDKCDNLRIEVVKQKAYIRYLRKWYAENSSLHFEGTEPESYKTFCEQREIEFLKKCPDCVYYKVRVTINEASHIIDDYYDVIKVPAPKDLTMDQLKAYIILGSPFSIEDYIEPTTDTPDVVTVEIYDFDLELIKIEEN